METATHNTTTAILRLRLLVAGLICCLLMVAGSLFGPARAQAGTVTVSPAFNPAAAYNYNGWTWGFMGFTMRLGGPGVNGNPVGPAGTYMWARTPDLPAQVNLSAVYYATEYQTGTGQHPWSIRMCARGIRVNPTGCGVGDPGDLYVLQPTNGSVWTRSGGFSCHTTLGCDAVQLEVYEPQSFGYIAFNGTAVELTDNTAPGINAYAGGNRLTSGVWLRGSVDGSIYTWDNGGVGVHTSALKIDGATNQSTTYSCPNWHSWQPCAVSQWWLPFVDTTSLSDGPHNVVYETTDAANTTAATGNLPIKVDNTKPDAPSGAQVSSDGLGNWSPTNDFELSWENGAEAGETLSQSGIQTVIVNVDPGEGQVTDPAPVEVPVGGSGGGMSATLTSVSGITVPANGKWRLTIQLRDGAGNLSPLSGSDDPDSGEGVEIGVDPAAPEKANGHVNNGWVSREELIGQTAEQTWDLPMGQDGRAPICGWGLSVSDNASEDGITSITVHSPQTAWKFPADLPEGTHKVHIRAINCAGTPADITEHKDVQVDRTDPAGAISGIEVGRWYKDGQQVSFTASDELSGMQPAIPSDPDSTNGAYFHYKINGDGPADEAAPRGPAANVTVSGEGWKVLKMNAVDFAGNRATEQKAEFGIDASNPEGYIEGRDPARPTLLKSVLTDGVSGLSHAVIQVRQAGGGEWQSLPTNLTGFTGEAAAIGPRSGIASARFPDTALPKGSYEMRTLAFDMAGNQLTTDRNQDGTKVVLTNPMRDVVGLSAAIFRGNHKKPVCAKRKRGKGSAKKRGKSRRSKCVKKVKGRVVLIGGKSSTIVGWKHAAVIQGYLTTAKYVPLGRRAIEIYSKVEGQAEKLEGTTSTDASGYYYYRIRPGLSRKLRVVFPGSELLEENQSALTLGQQARVTMKVNKKHVTSGGRVTFRGRATTRDGIYPVKGKLVILQFYSAKKWRPAITVARTDKKGAFKVSYRFRRLPRNVRARIKFRVFVPSEVDFHHATSASPTRIVRVN